MCSFSADKLQTDQDNKFTNSIHLRKVKVSFTIPGAKLPSAPSLELSTYCISSEFDKSVDNAFEKTTRYKKIASLILVLVAFFACVGIMLILLRI